MSTSVSKEIARRFVIDTTIAFLSNRGFLGHFFHNINDTSSKKSVLRAITSNGHYDIINNAFQWSFTPQGFTFWNTIDSQILRLIVDKAPSAVLRELRII